MTTHHGFNYRHAAAILRPDLLVDLPPLPSNRTGDAPLLPFPGVEQQPKPDQDREPKGLPP